MANTVIKVFESFSNAENARNALLAAGFPPASVRLSSREDEAGPVKGNFILDGSDADTDGAGDLSDSLSGSKNNVDSPVSSDVKQGGVYLLAIGVEDDDQLALASGIVKQFGGIDVD